MGDVIADLAAEQTELDAMVAPLPAAAWDTPTPADPWTIRDQISHLAFFEEKVTLSLTDPVGFIGEAGPDLADGFDVYIQLGIDRGRALAPEAVLGWWRQARQATLAALGDADPESRYPWYGPKMRARTVAAARIMETWAHGQDVADTLGVTRAPTDRLFHVAELGVVTYRHAFDNRRLDPPTTRVRVALRGPSGTTRVWNDGSDSSVTGPVEEFCLVVTQRRHLADTHLVIEGEPARRWMEIAQIYLGPPGPGRPAIT